MRKKQACLTLHMRIALLLISTLLILGSCQEPNDITNLELEKVFGKKSWIEASSSNLKVYYFLAPECPLCQNYAVEMRNLKSKFPEVEFIGIFPGEEYTREEIRQYMHKFKLDFNSYLDPNFILTGHYEAEITPEAVLVDSDDKVWYSGAIDNWAISLGQKRTVVTRHYLSEAIEAQRDQQVIDPKKSKAVGCYIQ